MRFGAGLAFTVRLGGGAATALFFFLFEGAARAFLGLAALCALFLAARFFVGEALAFSVEARALLGLARFSLLALCFIPLAADFLVLARLHECGGARILFFLGKRPQHVGLGGFRRLYGFLLHGARDNLGLHGFVLLRAKDAALLRLDDDGLRPAMAEALLDRARFGAAQG